MSQPRKVAQAFEHYAIWNASLADGDTAQVPFTPVDHTADGPPTGAADGAVPVLIAHEILVSNPGTFAIEVTPAAVQSSDTTKAWLPFRSTMKPAYVDPTTFPAVTAANAIIVPAGAIDYPIRVRSFGVTVKSAGGATTPSIAAYGPLSLEA